MRDSGPESCPAKLLGLAGVFSSTVPGVPGRLWSRWLSCECSAVAEGGAPDGEGPAVCPAFKPFSGGTVLSWASVSAPISRDRLPSLATCMASRQ